MPSQVPRTLRSSHSPTPTCFCLEPAKYVNPIVNGQFAGKHAFACKTRSCSYWVVVDDLLAGTDGGLEYEHYPARGSRKLPPTRYLTLLPCDPASGENLFCGFWLRIFALSLISLCQLRLQRWVEQHPPTLELPL
ncbi:hypothetical protein B0H14DRAFT_3502020 [Mycena olivaceomarginata]|nr:hypothetical protein B0H14DRAFT_3502020 [Mycena olivaceomarginata]